MQKIWYITGLLILVSLYAFQLRGTGFRLPAHYLPDGRLIRTAITDSDKEKPIRHILEIKGRAPQVADVFFDSDQPIPVLTDTGPGLITPVPVDRVGLLIEFAPFILLSALYLIAGIWFVEYGNDFHLSGFCILACSSLFAFVSAVAGHRFDFAWQILGFILLPAIVNLGLRTTGKDISGYLLLAEVLVGLFLSLIAYVGAGNLRTFSNLLNVQHASFYLCAAGVALVQIDNALRTAEDRIDWAKKWLLAAGTIIGLIAPFLLMDLVSDPRFRNFWFICVLGAACPIGLVYGTYRIHVLPFQFILGRSILLAMLTLFFVAIYAGVLLAHSLLLPDQDEKTVWIVHLVFLLTLVFFLDPARTWISAFAERTILRLDENLSESLKRIAGIFSESSRIDVAAHNFLLEVKRTLHINRASLLISEKSFPAFRVRDDLLLRIPDSNPIWRHLHPEKIVVSSYLTFASGTRGLLYRFLIERDVMLASGVSGPEVSFLARMLAWMGIRPFDASRIPRLALLVGFRTDRGHFTLSEIRYVAEATRLARMLALNSEIVIQEVEKRRKMREIHLAGQTQRIVSGDWIDDAPTDIRISAISMPVLSVTGDYLDLVKLPGNRLAFFLGDVSGHGLGTGYLVSAMRAMVRSHLQSGFGLSDTVGLLNSFLLERYRGNEFITVIGFFLDTESGKMEYLNAAHPGPYILRADKSIPEYLRESQRLTGLLPDPYTTSIINLKKGDRIFLYSDGVTETFSQRAEPYGDNRLRTFLTQFGRLPVEEIPDLLKKNLAQHRQLQQPEDDTTFVAIEYTPRPRGIFAIFGDN